MENNNEALERGKEIYEKYQAAGDSEGMKNLEYIFPELVPSGEGAKKKRLIDIIRGTASGPVITTQEEREELEKWVSGGSWDDDDKRIIENVIMDIEASLEIETEEEYRGYFVEELDWLHVLLNRIRPEIIWTEEDREAINKLYFAADSWKDGKSVQLLPETGAKLCNWLKSLRGRLNKIPAIEYKAKEEKYKKAVLDGLKYAIGDVGLQDSRKILEDAFDWVQKKFESEEESEKSPRMLDDNSIRVETW